MEKLIYLGEELDPTTEHELFSTNPFGFTVDVTYSDDSLFLSGIRETFNNVTEVHNLFEGLISKPDSLAIESDIHFTGLTRKIEDLKSVIITKATELADEF